MRFYNIILLSLFIILSLSCKNNNNGYSKNSDIHIQKKSKINYYLNKEANIQTENAVKYAFDRWENKSHFDFEYKGRHYAGLRRDNKNTVSFLVKWPKKIPANKIAWCHNWYDRKGNIVETDIIFNMTITKFTTLDSDSKNSYYIEGVLTHEIGHMIGLNHIDSDDSIMKMKSNMEESFFKGNIDNITLNEYLKLYNIK